MKSEEVENVILTVLLSFRVVFLSNVSSTLSRAVHAYLCVCVHVYFNLLLNSVVLCYFIKGHISEIEEHSQRPSAIC